MVDRIASVVKKHWAVFALAVLVSGIYGSHHYFIPRILDNRVGTETGRGTTGDGVLLSTSRNIGSGTYHPLTFAAHPDAAFYGLRANAVYYGEWRTGDVSVPDNAASPWTLPPFGAVLIGAMGRVLGSLDRAFIVSDLLFPPLIFIVLYFLAFELTGARALSLFFASFFIFTPMALLAFPPITPSLARMLMERIMPEPASILYFSRLEYPKTTFLFYALAIYGVLRTLRRDERWSVWLAGICFGLMFYNYLYDWMYFFIALCLAAVFLVITGRRAACMRLAKIAGIGFALSLPYWYNLFLLRRLPQYHELEARIGIETGRAFRWASVWKSYARNILFGLLAAGAMPRRRRTTLYWIIGLLTAFLVAVNLQVIVGFNPHPDHWYRISFLPVGLAMLAAGYWAARRYVPARVLSYGSAVAALGIALILGRSLVSQYQYSNRDAQYYALDPAYAAAYAWLEREGAKNATVASLDFSTNNELALPTPQKTFVVNAVHTGVSDDAVWDRFIAASAVGGVSPEHFAELIQTDPVLFHLTHNAYRDHSFDSSFRYDAGAVRRLPEDVREHLIGRYKNIMDTQKEGTLILPDYLLIGPREEKIAAPAIGKTVRKVYDANGIRIYRAVERR